MKRKKFSEKLNEELKDEAFKKAYEEERREAMTVKELIDILKTMPEDSEIYTYDEEAILSDKVEVIEYKDTKIGRTKNRFYWVFKKEGPEAYGNWRGIESQEEADEKFAQEEWQNIVIISNKGAYYDS